MRVNECVRDEILDQFRGLIGEHMTNLDKGYLNAEDDPFTISLKAVLSPLGTEDGIKVTTSMSYVVEKVSDSAKGVVTANPRPKQMTIDQGEPQKDMGNRKKPFLHRWHPRHLIDTRKITCLKGPGKHCTLRYPCFICPSEQ